MSLPTFECLRCGWRWHPRSNKKPDRCPKCNSPYWDSPPGKAALIIENDDQDIISSNFWDSEMAVRGYFFLSINAGAARLLIPDAHISQVPDMETGKIVIVSRGPGMGRKDMFEVMFDDGSDEPYSIHFGVQQIDRLIPVAEHGRDLVFSVWGRNAVKLFERPGKFRVVDQIPCLGAWGE